MGDDNRRLIVKIKRPLWNCLKLPREFAGFFAVRMPRILNYYISKRSGKESLRRIYLVFYYECIYF